MKTYNIYCIIKGKKRLMLSTMVKQLSSLPKEVNVSIKVAATKRTLTFIALVKTIRRSLILQMNNKKKFMPFLKKFLTMN